MRGTGEGADPQFSVARRLVPRLEVVGPPSLRGSGQMPEKAVLLLAGSAPPAKPVPGGTQRLHREAGVSQQAFTTSPTQSTHRPPHPRHFFLFLRLNAPPFFIISSTAASFFSGQEGAEPSQQQVTCTALDFQHANASLCSTFLTRSIRDAQRVVRAVPVGYWRRQRSLRCAVPPRRWRHEVLPSNTDTI